MQKIIVTTLSVMTALIPLIFTTQTSELFEFPKFIVLLTGTIIISVAWLMHAVVRHDFTLFEVQKERPQHSLIHWSVIGVLATQLVATIFSIHPYTSFWGYYSRFHQGLLTTICYSIIYFSAVKWLDTESTRKIVKISVSTAFVISIIAILEHFDISISCLIITGLSYFESAQGPLIYDTSCWGAFTNPLERSFATLGQPNWLAAYVVPNIFLSFWLSGARQKTAAPPRVSPLLIATSLLVAVLMSKSRSGFLAFILSYGAYWLLTIRNFGLRAVKRRLIQSTTTVLVAVTIFGSPFTSSVRDVLTEKTTPPAPVTTSSGTVLEIGGTESGDIRKIVWGGALSLISHHLLIGTGPETFAYTYYWERPVTHNYTSEWDFLYNKAHNEYLNIAATTGLLGVGAYLLWHYSLILAAFTEATNSGKKAKRDDEHALSSIYPVVGASIIAYSVTSFFGFSVIPVYFLLVLIAVFPSTIASERVRLPRQKEVHYWIFAGAITILLMIPLRVYRADLHYTRGKAENNVTELEKAVKLRPQEDLYRSYLAELYATRVVATDDTGLRERAEQEIRHTARHNPFHLNYFKSRAKAYLTLAASDPSYYSAAAEELRRARELAPTDPKLAYNLGLVYSRLGDITKAEIQMNQAIELKKNYQDAYYALTLIYEQTEGKDKIPQLLQTARENLATYSGLLQEKMDKYPPTAPEN